MTPGIGISAYVDVPAYLRAAANQETASLLGLNTTVGGTSVSPASTTSLPVASSTGWVSGPLWLLDGPYSEMGVRYYVRLPPHTYRPLVQPIVCYAISQVSALLCRPCCLLPHNRPAFLLPRLIVCRPPSSPAR